MDELQVLRTRVGEMAAEIERLTTESARLRAEIEESRKALNAEIILSDSRAEHVKQLQSVIDEANAQEYSAIIREGCDYLWAEVSDKHNLKHGDVLYARPIPEQQSTAAVPADCLSPTVASSRRYGQPTERNMQSPAVAGHDSDGVSIIEAALKKVSSGNLSEAPFPLTGENAQCYLNGAASAYQHSLEMLCVSSPRITEQDAREIIISCDSWVEARLTIGDLDEYFKDEGCALLDKLNGVKNETN